MLIPFFLMAFGLQSLELPFLGLPKEIQSAEVLILYLCLKTRPLVSRIDFL